MKRFINIIFTILATAAVLSCGPDVEIPEGPDKPNQPEKPTPGPEEPEDDGFGGDVTFTATIESISDGTQPLWKKGDVISIYDGTSTVKATNTADDGAVGTFPATIKKGTESVFALSPSNDGVQLSSTGVLLDIPVEQSIASPVPAYRVAKSKNSVLYFRNLLAVLNLSVGIDGVTSVVIKADDAAKIAGTMAVDYSGESPAVAASSSQIVVKGSFQKGQKYPVLLAPAKLTKCSVEAYVGDSVVAQADLDGQTLNAGTVLEMPSMAPKNPIYRITNMWVWGGTGNSDYDFTKVFDILTLPDFFNNEDGRGINAIKDNYLVFNSDGTFRNWAGEDGRNWWFVYSGSKNPETHTDLDLSGFYDQLPRSTATYVNEDGVITFTRPDGTTVNADLLPAGTYVMPDTNPEKVIEITREALRFNITGGRSNVWTDIIYNDYWKIAGNPRQLFIELEKMPDGFTVPAAFQTTDADFKFEPPVYEFDMSSLPGTWNVYGGNSAPFGIWVNGGTGSSAAFVSPIDKAWCWNDSIYKESDNTLSISLTGRTETTISGTIEWGPGADGAYWDCKWNRQTKKGPGGNVDDENYGADLSKYYKPIPEGVSSVTVNLQTGAGTIGTDVAFTFLKAGVHVFTFGKTLVIPSGCFALSFHLMDSKETVDQYNLYEDVDRFVYAPLDYVIIFEKQQ
ncbi:MAG: hypothetical protein IKN93_02500 [Bacteroidales bacterium]|nr:hypothetical protein [Bacteroidales bacterium]